MLLDLLIFFNHHNMNICGENIKVVKKPCETVSVHDKESSLPQLCQAVSEEAKSRLGYCNKIILKIGVISKSSLIDMIYD